MPLPSGKATAISLDVVSSELTITGRFSSWQLRSVSPAPAIEGLELEFLIDLFDDSAPDTTHALFGFRSRKVEALPAGLFRAWGRARTPHGYDVRTHLSLSTLTEDSGLLGLSLSMSYEKLDEYCWREIREALLRRTQPPPWAPGPRRIRVAEV